MISRCCVQSIIKHKNGLKKTHMNYHTQFQVEVDRLIGSCRPQTQVYKPLFPAFFSQFLDFPLMNNTFSYMMKAPCVFSIWSIWAFISSAKHRHLEFLLLIPMEKKKHFLPSSSILRVIRFTCLQTTYILLYHSAVTAYAHRKSEVRSYNVPTRNVYVTLVYVFLFAVALLWCDMLW